MFISNIEFQIYYEPDSFETGGSYDTDYIRK